LTNYKKLKIAATQQLYKQKTRKTNEDIPIFFYKLFFIYKKISAIISKYLANMGFCVCIKTRKSALPQQKTR